MSRTMWSGLLATPGDAALIAKVDADRRAARQRAYDAEVAKAAERVNAAIQLSREGVRSGRISKREGADLVHAVTAEAIAPVVALLAKQVEAPTTRQQQQEALRKALVESIASLSARVEKIATARGQRQSATADEVRKRSPWRGML